jgi:hypothetical protein
MNDQNDMIKSKLELNHRVKYNSKPNSCIIGFANIVMEDEQSNYAPQMKVP